MSDTPSDPGVSRRDLLKTGAGAVALAVSGVQLATPAQAQTPKKGGTLRLTFQADPLHFDPHQTLSFVTMCPLSLCYSRLVKVKAGPTVKPMTYPVEADLAESWSQANDTTYIFKLKKGVRWHNKPPVNGREFTADDVKYTYEHSLHFSTRRVWSWRAEFGSESRWAQRLGREVAARGADTLWSELTAR